MCGVLGLFYEKGPVAMDLLEGLLALQHRGQNSAGILTSDITLHLKKGNGLVTQVFNEKNLARLTGSLGIGHTRYPTIGPGSSEDAQPFYVNYPYGIAMAHNGNVTNYFHLREELKKKDRRQLTSFCDLEPILHIFAGELEKTKGTRVKPDDVFRAIQAVFRRTQGAYSVVGLIHRQGLFAFRDAKGIRPLVIARDGRSFAVASESVALDILGFKQFRDIRPGEAIFIDAQHRLHRREIKKGELYTCIFEFVYFARPDSVIDNIEVYEARLRLGEKLAAEVRRRGLKPDMVIAVPDTARPAGVALARMLGLELREGLIKNRYIARTFIMPWQSNRSHSVRQKLNPVRSQIQGKDVLLVDDSIVRGTTSKEIVQMIREAGARKVFLAITAPPLRYPCVYGIDMMTRGEFIAKGRTEEEVCQIIGSDALIYQTYDGLIEAVRGEQSSRHFCTACFKGVYPTGITRKDLKLLEAERTYWMRTAVEKI
ncbi:amidophosphoribosyltransferase [candidate division WOR-3 bacterium]|nr:amidophosphoribosyltransferase [candidate division WOR-3 bacterium]